MFKFLANPTFSWPVLVRTPQAGNVVESRFTATFVLLPQAERDRLGVTGEGTDELLRRSLIGLDGVVNDDGIPLPWSDDLTRLLVANPWVRRGLVEAYSEALAGVPSAAAAGN